MQCPGGDAAIAGRVDAVNDFCGRRHQASRGVDSPTAGERVQPPTIHHGRAPRKDVVSTGPAERNGMAGQ